MIPRPAGAGSHLGPVRRPAHGYLRIAWIAPLRFRGHHADSSLAPRLDPLAGDPGTRMLGRAQVEAM